MIKIISKGMLLLIILFGYLPGKTFASQPEISKLNSVIKAIAKVESNNNPKAIGNKNCVGLLQITPILVKECNLILKEQKSIKRFTLSDRLDPDKSIEMFKIIQNKYNPNFDVETAIRLWNGGPKFSKTKTQKYFNKVKKYL